MLQINKIIAEMALVIFIIGIFNFLNPAPAYLENKVEIVEQKVTENRTSMGGIYYSYEIKNNGTSTLFPRTYEIEFRVDGKLVSFDKATSGIKPGQTITYKSQKTFYPSKKRSSISYELVTKIKYKNPSEVILFGKSEF